MALPAILYLHVSIATRKEQRIRAADALHLIGPLSVNLFLFTPPVRAFLDMYILLAQVFYLVLIAQVSRRGANSFKALGAQLSALFDRWRKLLIAFLIVSTLLDASIMLEVGGDAGALGHSWMIGLSSIVLVLGLSYLMISGLHRTGPLIWAGTALRRRNPGHEELIECLEELLSSTRAFLDPNLTIQRFSRRSGVTTRDVSAAINDLRHCNFNQWLNGFRTEEARRIMREDPSRNMTDVMHAAGFQNKSTFNAAFKAIEGTSPGRWRDQQIGGAR
jgi:AraC-like DNA-binding protein